MQKICYYLLLILITGCGQESSHSTEPATSIDGLMGRYDLPGIAMMTLKEGVVTELAVTGVRKSGSPEPLEENDPFHLGSCTKAMTATLVGIFVEEGKLSWTSTLSELLPEIALHPDYQNVTIEMLLAHRSGISKDIERVVWLWPYLKTPGLSPQTGRELLTRELLALPRVYPQGKFGYSNVGYVIVGTILEKIGEKAWESLMRERIFLPLEMKSCGFGATSEPYSFIVNRPWGHQKLGQLIAPLHFDNPATYGPATSVHCSMRDWGKFLNQHLQGFNGVSGLLKDSTYKKLHTAYPATDVSYTYGGWGLLERSWALGPALTHNGSNTANFSLVWMAPRKKMIFLSVTNYGGDGAESAVNEAVGQMINRNH